MSLNKGIPGTYPGQFEVRTMNVLSFRLLALAAIITFLSYVSASSADDNDAERYDKSRRANNMLLDNMTKYYQGITPARITGIILPRGYKRPDNVEVDDPETIRIKDELWNFSPHFLFAEDWFNREVHETIFEIFPRGHVMDNPTTPDYVALITIKYLTRKYVCDRDNFVGVISFLFEMVFGPDAYFPKNEELEWRFFLGDKVQSYQLPMTLEYYNDYLRSNPRYITPSGEAWINYFKFLSSNPSVEEHLAHIEEHFYRRIPFGIARCQVQRILYEKALNSRDGYFSDVSELFSYLEAIAKVGPNAPASLISRISSFYTSNVQTWLNRKPNWTAPIIYKIFGWPENDEALKYLLTRDYLNPFHIEEFKQLAGDCPDRRLKGYMSSVMDSNLKILVKMNIVDEMAEAYPDLDN